MKTRKTSLTSPVSTACPALPSRWFYGSAIDLAVGCCAWSEPLLLLAYYCNSHYQQSISIVFYALALVFNYPHYMATIYRAYRTREDFARYKFFTLHLTIVLAAVLLAAHLSQWVLALVFTLYLTWSPFHYTGQNFGIALMFARRNGVKPANTARTAFYATFLASYLMFFIAVHSLYSSDQYVLTLGIPSKLARILWCVALAVFVASSAYSFFVFSKQVGWRKLTAPLVMLSTQVIWFVVPTALELFPGLELLQARATTGMLAVMHSAQYLWITSYYARRESQAGDGELRQNEWRPYVYFLALVIGGIALFIPGPWLASRVFHSDFMSSFLAFTALVNIHHFLLDGALWKLRDGRIAALLLNTVEHHGNVVSGFNRVTSWLRSPSSSVRFLRLTATVALILIAGLDQVKFFYGAQASDAARLKVARELNPYDASLQVRLARASDRAGDQTGRRVALESAVQINPGYQPAQISLAKLLIDSGKYEEAYAHYQNMFQQVTPDVDSLVNFGILAAQLNHSDQAIVAWQKALDRDSNQANTHLYLADALLQQRRFKEAMPHYERYLALIANRDDGLNTNQQLPNPDLVLQVVLRLAETCHNAGDDEAALHFFSQGAALAHRFGNQHGLALAWIETAQIEASQGKNSAALAHFQQTLTLESAGSILPQAADWYGFAIFLKQIGAPTRLVRACLVKADALLAAAPAEDKKALAPVITEALRQTEATLGATTSNAVKRDLEATLCEALSMKN